MGNIPDEIRKLIEEMKAKTLSHEQKSTSPSQTRIDLDEERQKFRDAFLKVEPNFDSAKSDRRILYSILAWVWRYDKWNYLHLDYDKGLFFYGTLGRGKTATLRALRTYMVDLYNRHSWKHKEDYRMGMRWHSASELANAYAAEGQPALTKFYDWECNLCIDELGREPNPANNYGTKLDVIQFLLQMRYDHRRTSVTHITTNLEINSIATAYGDYVADRCLEMFNFVEFKGKSLRR